MAESTKNIGRVIMLYKGEYSPATTYTKLDVVYQDSTKSSYISLQDNNIGKEPKDNPTFWGVISKAKYDVNSQDIKDAVANVIATSDFKVGNMDIVTGTPRIDFHFNSSDKPTSSIKEFRAGILHVPGSLVVLGDLIANANSAMSLDHPIKINGQEINTVVNNNSKLTADVQVNTLKASTDLSDLSVYPSLNATYGLSGKYVASPNDATSYTAILQVSSYPDASHVRLTLIDTGTLGSIYTRTYTSGNWSAWQKIVIDSDTIAKASTAGKLAKAVSINGTAFDGSSDIAVNAANDNSLVHQSGNESIAGNKTFTGTVTAGGTKLTDSGWKNLSSPSGSVKYRILNGVVHLSVISARENTGKTIATLPVGARPGQDVWTPYYSDGVSGNYKVQPDGKIYRASESGSFNHGESSMLTAFPADN